MKSLNDYIRGINTDDVNLSYEDYIKDNIRKSTYVLDKDIEKYIDEHLNEVDEQIFESILRSYSMEKFVDAIKRRFHFEIISFAYGSHRNEEGNKYYDVAIYVNHNFDLENTDFKSLCNLYNVYISSITDKKNCIEIIFKQRKTKEATEKIYAECKYLYHITKSQNVDKILRYGLQPKSHSKKAYHPERIYVLSDKVPYSDIKKYMDKLEGNILLQIDLSKTVNDKLKLYVDPDSGYVDGYFCENFIPPSCISVVGKTKEFLMKIFK